MKVLDCTLRDGGYYNNWDFEPLLVDSYLAAMADSGIEYIELGLRNFSKKGFCGAFAYTSDSYLDRLNLPSGPTYGVMVDAGTILKSNLSIEDAVAHLFRDASDSKVSLVRVAAHFHEVEQSGLIVQELKRKGYLVGFNLMQAGGKHSDVITEKAKLAKSWKALDVLYFADSLGNMDDSEVVRIIDAIREVWDGEMGIHTHNNMGKALDNSMVALSKGVSWIDSTVTGMGRGAGNAQTESLLATLCFNDSKYRTSKLYELVIREFEPMQKHYGWGSNLLYFLGAQHNVHPTYIQSLLSDTHYGTDEIVGAIEYLKGLADSSSYSDDKYVEALSFGNTEQPVSGTDTLVNVASEREVLIIASGPSLKKYEQDIKSYIKTRKPVVLAINALPNFESYVSFYCLSHNNKILSEGDVYSQLKQQVILPKHRFSDDELARLFPQNECLDYGLVIKKSIFEISSSNCTLPYDLTAGYAFSIAEVMGASSISVAGFDGYESTDPRQSEMLELVSSFRKQSKIDNILALTPTSYSIQQGSLYEFI